MRAEVSLERFNEYLDKSGECWLWTGYRDKGGYGRANGQVASRAAYRLFVGPIPPRMWVLHRCDTPSCCRPEHLFLGTHADNMADMKAKGRWNGPRGAAVLNRARLREDQVRRVLSSAERNRDLAKEFAVSEYCIWAIRNGRTWKHISRGAAS